MNRAYDTNDAAMEDSEEDENVTQISKMGDCEIEDMRIWTQSKADKTNYRGTQWLFGPGILYICEEEAILTIQVNSQVHSELALFDMMCIFWRLAPFLAEHHTLDLHFCRMAQYHSMLHHKVTRVLKDAGPNEHDTSSLLLRPWLRRSLFRYQHDDESRKILQDISLPVYLVNSVVLAIFSKPAFQAYANFFRTILIRGSPFICPFRQRSWHIKTLWNSQHAQKAPQEELKSIFFLPYERHTHAWNIYFNMKHFDRKSLCVDKKAFSRLCPGQYLNCDIINAYVKLLHTAPRKGVIVSSTYFITLALDNLDNKVVNLKAAKGMLGADKNEKRSDSVSLSNLVHQQTEILLPVNWGTDHWFSVLLNVPNKQIVFMDSLKSHTGKSGRTKVFKALRAFLELKEGWRAVEKEVPQQPNTWDCGVYCAQFIKHAFFQQTIPEWTEDEVMQLRHMMAIEIYEGSIRWYDGCV